ncbi:ABC transporter ATP-binding protein [Tomitella gaofuii]|uniref:ABC transporter ATP-binding protein n=1 Tax=Tomitella gaofuii TaxID=2760083 RepID=UPI0015FBC3C2|nr:ATP-binding cassette domain-containing protein [Tomitella gaofuii]
MTVRTGLQAPAAATVRGLTVRIPARVGRRRAWVHAATDVDLDLAPGTVTALVGESGCGKSILASALCGMLPDGTRTAGTTTIDGRTMTGAKEKDWRRLRGRTVALATQSAAASFTPVRAIGPQLAEVLHAVGVTGSARGAPARAAVADLLARVHLGPDTARLYPHELSGGMAQRVAVAAALAGAPPVLVADEPTAGLDPGLAAHVLGLLREAADGGAAVLLITHDLQSVESTGVADHCAVMYAGRIVERGTTGSVFSAPAHAYTAALLAALPSRGLHPIPGAPPELTDLDPQHDFAARLRAVPHTGSTAGHTTRDRQCTGHRAGDDAPGAALRGEDLTCRYGATAVFSGASVTVAPGSILGLTGVSGSGKSSLARMLCGLQIPLAGSVTVDGRAVSTRRGRMRGDTALLHQSPRAAADPRMTLRALIAEPGASAEEVAGAAALAGITPDLLDRFPGQVSDGQLQRACLARALVARPRFLICDEATAMLDAATAAAVAAIITELAADGVGVLMISHDHGLLRAVAHRTVDMRDIRRAGTGGSGDAGATPA